MYVCAAAERFLASAGWTDYLKLRGDKKKGKREKAREKSGQKGHSDPRAVEREEGTNEKERLE